MNLPGITAHDLLLLVFVVGNLVERFKATRASLKSQGERLGALEKKVAALEAAAAGRTDGR